MSVEYCPDCGGATGMHDPQAAGAHRCRDCGWRWTSHGSRPAVPAVEQVIASPQGDHARDKALADLAAQVTRLEQELRAADEHVTWLQVERDAWKRLAEAAESRLSSSRTGEGLVKNDEQGRA